MDSTGSPTIGALFFTLREMGFSEEQIQAAVQAGHFSVPAAAEWLLQGHHLRHKLVKHSAQPAETAFSAFNPPKAAAAGTSGSEPQAASDDGPAPACTLLTLRTPLGSASSPEPPTIESRVKADVSDFQEQRQRVAQEARAERRQKRQERELVLLRIAEDRRSLQEKTQSSAAESAAPTEQALGGKIQTNVDNNCILMIRLPSGESMRERFPADAPLRSVVEHISGRHPSLPSFSLLQGFPRKRFGEAELSCSLRSLGLTPNAALCIQTTPLETPQQLPSPVAPPPPQREAEPPLPLPAQGEAEEEEEPVLPPPLLPPQLWEEAVGYAGIPGVGPPLPGPSHFWGRGRKLVPGVAEDAPSPDEDEDEDDDDDDEDVAERQEEPPPMVNGMPRLPFLPENRLRGGFEPRHRWPEQGNRLREEPAEEPAEAEDAGMRAVPRAAGLAAVERLQRAAQDEPPTGHGHPSPPKRAFRAPSVSTLCSMATRATVHLMTAPSMQYSSSLSCLTPELAELLLGHMSRERLLRPRTLELFFGCPLQKFVLNCYPYSTNDLLRQLRAFPALKHLSLVNSPLITDSGLSVLSSLVKLQYLNLASCSKLTDSCLHCITGLKSLCFLTLDQTKVTDAGVVSFLRSAPPSLTQLSLNQTAVTELTMRALPSCVPQLRLLSIKQTRVRDVSALAELHCLQTLHLDGTGVAEEALTHLAAHPALATLSLAGVAVKDGDRALEIISGLRLTQLNLPGRHLVTDSGLAFLCRLRLLTELDLTDYTQVTDQGVRQLSSMTRLKRLSLSNIQLTDAGLPALCGLQDLQELYLNRTTVSSRGVAALVTRLPHLQVLSLASTRVGDNVVRRGVTHCPQLVKLNLSQTRVTDHSLRFLRGLQLVQVNLDGSGVTLAGVAGLLALTSIRSVRASGTRNIALDDVSDDDGESQ